MPRYEWENVQTPQGVLPQLVERQTPAASVATPTTGPSAGGRFLPTRLGATPLQPGPAPIAPVPSAPAQTDSSGDPSTQEFLGAATGALGQFQESLQARFNPDGTTYVPTTARGTVGDLTQGAFDTFGYTPRNDRAAQAINQGVNTGIDLATGLPFGIASTLVNPRNVATSWGTPFNTGGGGIIGIGGELSRRNLENIYGNAIAERAPTGETNQDYLNEAFGGGAVDVTSPDGANRFYAPGTINTTGFGGTDTVTTPLATSPALGGVLGDDWQVISGNTDLALQQNPHLDLNRDGQLTPTELQDYHAAQQREAEIARLAEQDRALAEAARQREAEQSRAAAAAQAAAQEAENRRRAAAELAASNAQRESEGRAQQQGSPVTDSRGNAVRDSSGNIVTDRPTQRDDNGGGGGGGGGTHCCTAAYRHGMPIRKIKELRKWHREQSQVWQDGYDVWGKYLADNLVSGSQFWSSVTEAGHDIFVERKVTPKGLLAWAMIVPGSYIAGYIRNIKYKESERCRQ